MMMEYSFTESMTKCFQYGNTLPLETGFKLNFNVLGHTNFYTGLDRDRKNNYS